MDKEPKNEAVSQSETALRIRELKSDIDKFVLIAEGFPSLKTDLEQICTIDFSDFNDPHAYARVEEYQELIGSGTRGEVASVPAEIYESVMYRIDLFLDEWESKLDSEERS